MSVVTTLNDQEIEGEEVCIGNDGCPVVIDHSPVTPLTPKESPSTPSGRSKSKSFVQSLKGAFYDEFHFEETPEYANSLKKMIVDGSDILSLTPTDINNMSLEKVNSLLAQLHIEGNLRKKGFRGFQMWKRRYFEVMGDTMMYFEIGNRKTPRKSCKITMDGKVMVENLENHPYAFSIQPSKTEQRYIVEAFSIPQRDQWIRFISLIIAIGRRLHSTTQSTTSFHESIHLLDTLGKGRYGIVRLAQSQTTGEMFAVKVISKNTVPNSVLQQELMVLRAIKDRIDNENIVKIVDVYEDSLLVHIVMEYMGGGDLFHRLEQKRYFSEKEAAVIIRHIGHAIQDLHKHGIYHLDVKPENIIYESNDIHSPMKLTDFGCSLLADHYNKETNEIVGTAGYMAPEVITNCQYSEKADVYSLGVTLFILLMGYPPFQADSPSELLNLTVSERIDYKEEDWETVSSDALLLVKNMLAKNPDERLSIEEVINFPWVNHPPASSTKWHYRYQRKTHEVLPMSFPSTLPGSHMRSI